jgi:galactonate dehydratase
MKIRKIETFKFWVDWCNWLFVRISTDEGLVGWLDRASGPSRS